MNKEDDEEYYEGYKKLIKKLGFKEEQLQQPKGTRKIDVKDIFKLLGVHDEDVDLQDSKGMIVTVERSNVFDSLNIVKGDKIKAVISSTVDKFGRTSIWSFNRIIKKF